MSRKASRTSIAMRHPTLAGVRIAEAIGAVAEGVRAAEAAAADAVAVATDAAVTAAAMEDTEAAGEDTSQGCSRIEQKATAQAVAFLLRMGLSTSAWLQR
jgi:hypothetical protein